MDTVLQWASWGLCVSGYAALLAGSREAATTLFVVGVCVSLFWGYTLEKR